MRIHPAAVIALLLFSVLPSFTQPSIYIKSSDGFNVYIIAAFTKKHVPVSVAPDEAGADFVLESTAVDVKQESGASKIARCLALYCIGIDGTQNVSVQLLERESRKTLWAYTVQKNSHAYQSSAEAIAKHLKEFLKDKKY